MITAIRRSRIIVAVAVLVVGASLLVWLVAPAHKATSSEYQGADECTASQISTSVVVSKDPYTPLTGFYATVWYVNQGKTCSFPVDNIPVDAVRGPQHAIVGSGSMSGAVAYPPLILNHGAKASAGISIGSIATRSFLKMEKVNGSRCQPALADAIRVSSLFGLHQHPLYLALAEQVPVCTKNFFNVSSGIPVKLLTPVQAKQAAVKAGVDTLQRFLSLWQISGQTSAAKYFLTPNQQGGNLKLQSGTVKSYSLLAWRSSSHFSLLVDLDLHFAGAHGTWSEGDNRRVVTFAGNPTTPLTKMDILIQVHGSQVPRVTASGRLLSTVTVDAATVIRPAAAETTPPLSVFRAEVAADRADFSPMSLGNGSTPAARIAYFGLLTSNTYPMVTNQLVWIVEYPGVRPVLLGPPGGKASPQPLLVFVDARTGRVYGEESTTIKVS